MKRLLCIVLLLFCPICRAESPCVTVLRDMAQNPPFLPQWFPCPKTVIARFLLSRVAPQPPPVPIVVQPRVYDPFQPVMKRI